MKTLFKYHLCSVIGWVVLLTTVFGISGCDKRPFTRLARIPLEVKLDWSKVKEGIPLPEVLKLYLFDNDGKLVAQYDIPKEGQVLGLLDVGVYNAVCVNVTNEVEIQKADRFETMQLAAKSYNVSQKQDASAGTIVHQPGWIFSEVVSDIRVGDPAITDGKGTLSTITIPMERIVKIVNFRFSVKGLTNEITSVTGTLSNIASVVNLSSGSIVGGHEAVSPFTLTYQEDGTIGGTMLIFGNEAEKNSSKHNYLNLRFHTASGHTVEHTADVTEQMLDGDVSGDIDIEIRADLEVQIDAGFVTIIIDWKPGSEEDIEGV